MKKRLLLSAWLLVCSSALRVAAAETNSEPAKDALKQAAEILSSTPQGREYLAKLSQAALAQESQKQTAAKQVKEAAVAQALQVLAAAVR